MNIYRQLERLALLSLNADACPAPEVLADYMLLQLTGTEQLQVAVHVRGCPLCQEEIELCRPPEQPRRMIIARIFPLVPIGLRSTTSTHAIRQYRAADMTIEITVVPSHGDYWRLTGQLLRNANGVASQVVVLRSSRRRVYRQESDHKGFFTFEDIPTGRYTLSVNDKATTIQIRGVILTHETT